MESTISVYCVNTQSYVDVPGGSTLMDVYRLLPGGGVPGLTPICAHVNHKNESLLYPVFNPKMVEFLGLGSPSGDRVYVRSLCMVLYRAVTLECPQARLHIEHSISRGYYCRLTDADLGPLEATPELVDRLRQRMRRIVDADLPLVRSQRLTREVIDVFRAQGLKDKINLLETAHKLYTVYYTLDGLHDSYYGPLAPSTGHVRVFDLRPYRDGMLLLGPDKASPQTPAAPVAQEKMFRAFTDYLAFNRIIGVSDAGEMNRAAETRRGAWGLVNVAEALHDKCIGRIGDEITRRYHQGGARIVLIAGPSSSGKTTTTKRLCIQLMTTLLRPVMISLDDYFVDRAHTPRDAAGELDYESLYALNLERFNRDLNLLLQGQEVALPAYDFERGVSTDRGRRIRLDQGSILLIEGIHGLNPELTAHIPEQMKFRLYVSALTTLSLDDHNWVPSTDNRLLRRIIRDNKYRGTSAADTISRWESVRRGEQRWIFPFQENADAVFNSSLVYELAVMKEAGEAVLGQVPRDVPQYSEAYRLRRFLSYFRSIPLSMVPSTSLLREFLGGSSFHY